MEKEPERDRWGLLCPLLISHPISALFAHFLSSTGGFKHPYVGSQAPVGLIRPFLLVPELVLLSPVCLFVTRAPFQLLISQVCF